MAKEKLRLDTEDSRVDSETFYSLNTIGSLYAIYYGLKIVKKKIPESSNTQNLNLPHTEHYAESTQMK